MRVDTLMHKVSGSTCETIREKGHMYVQYVKTLFPTANPSGTTCSSTIVMFKAVGKVSINECNKNVQCTRVLKSAELRKLGRGEGASHSLP